MSGVTNKIRFEAKATRSRSHGRPQALMQADYLTVMSLLSVASDGPARARTKP
jgi:hypothetical protein